MRSHAVTLLILGSGALAIPQPKLPSIKYPSRQSAAQARPARHAAASLVTTNTTANTTVPSVKAPATNVWNSLTVAEAAEVVQFLHKQEELNLTNSADAGSWDNLISVIDLAQPNKTAALAYMNGTAPAPERYARASLMFGATEEPYLEDFLIGPLPVSNLTTWAPDDWSTTKGTSKIRNYDTDPDLTSAFWYQQAALADDIIVDLLGANSSTFDIWGIDPLWKETVDGEEHIVNWVSFFGIPTTVFDGETLLPQGIYFKIDQTGRDPSKWFLVGWLYRDIYYTSTEAFREAWKAPDFVKAARNVQGDWIGSDRVGDELKWASV